MAPSCASTLIRSMCATRRKLSATIPPTTHKGCLTSWTASSLDGDGSRAGVCGGGVRDEPCQVHCVSYLYCVYYGIMGARLPRVALLRWCSAGMGMSGKGGKMWMC